MYIAMSYRLGPHRYSQVVHKSSTSSPHFLGRILAVNRRFLQTVLPNRPGRIAQLLSILLLVVEASGCASRRPAPLLVQPASAACPTVNTPRAPTLKLLTFNVWGLPSWITGARPGRYPRIARELERIDADVVLLQEVWTANARKCTPANRQWSVARAAGQHTLFQQSGLMVLSKFPILDGKFYPFSRAALPDRLVNKGVLKVTLRLPGDQLLNVWDAHLQDGGSLKIRQSQVRELIAHVQSADDGQIADLVGGDFNCTPESSLCHELEDSLGPSLQQLGGGKPFVTWDGLSAKRAKGQTLDYVFVRPRAIFPHLQGLPQVVFSSESLFDRLSDHFGVEAVFSLSRDARLADLPNPSNSAPARGLVGASISFSKAVIP
jgi:endonuclease/exonuclease/phosphatase family metal-dependent hydrolase